MQNVKRKNSASDFIIMSVVGIKLNCNDDLCEQQFLEILIKNLKYQHIFLFYYFI